jgi:hypothetical protein
MIIHLVLEKLNFYIQYLIRMILVKLNLKNNVIIQLPKNNKYFTNNIENMVNQIIC